MADIRQRVVLDLDSSGYQSGIARAKAAEKGLASRITAVGRRAERVGRTMTRSLTLPFAVAGGLAVKAAVDFESAFAGVRKTVDATEEEFAALSDGLREMATEMPVTVEELAAIGEAAGQLGIEKDAILGFTETVAKLGVATNLTSEQAATSLARIANVTGLASDKFDELGAALVDLGNNSATTEKEILNFAQRVAPTADLAGFAEAEVLALGAAFSSVGVRAERGGTAVQKVLLSMSDAVAQSNEDLQTFADTAGMSAEEFQQAFEEDAATAFASFVEGLGEQGDEASGTLEELGLADQRLMQAFLSLAGAGDLLRDSIKRGNAAFEENEALVKEAAQRFGTTESQMRTLLNQFNDMGIEIGQRVIPKINEAMESMDPEDMKEIGDAIGDFLVMAVEVGQQFLDIWSDIPDEVKKLGMQAAALGAVAGPVIRPVGGLLRVLGGLGRVTGLGRTAGGVATVASEVRPFGRASREAAKHAGVFSSKLRMLGGAAGVAAAAFAGWEIGSMIREKFVTPWLKAKEAAEDASQQYADFGRQLGNFMDQGRLTAEEVQAMQQAMGELRNQGELTANQIANFQGVLTLAAKRGADMDAVTRALSRGMNEGEVRARILAGSFGALSGTMRTVQTEEQGMIRLTRNASGEFEVLRVKGGQANQISMAQLQGSVSEVANRLNITEDEARQLLGELRALDAQQISDKHFTIHEHHVRTETVRRRHAPPARHGTPSMPGGGEAFHTGGEVMHAGGPIPRMHLGGVTPTGLGPNERHIIGEVGEFMFDKTSTSNLGVPFLRHLQEIGKRGGLRLPSLPSVPVPPRGDAQLSSEVRALRQDVQGLARAVAGIGQDLARHTHPMKVTADGRTLFEVTERRRSFTDRAEL